MDKQKKIEEMAKCTCGNYNNGGCEIDGFVCNYRCSYYEEFEKLYNAGYRKIPENAVVLTDDNVEELADIIVKSPKMQETMSRLIKAWRKETAEEFAEMLEKKASKLTMCANGVKIEPPVSYTLSHTDIYEICKEFTNGKSKNIITTDNE